MNEKQREKFKEYLIINSRETLTNISKLMDISISTLYDELREIEKNYRFTMVRK